MTIKLPARRNFLKDGMAAALGAAAFPLISPSLLANKPATPSTAATSPQASASAASARIKIDFDRQIGTIDRNIYGNFIEHLGRCIYGGIYDEGSPLSDSDGFRKDVLEAARGLHIPLLRWPGGNFSSGYNWRDGIGPKDSRPRRWDTAWQAEESNRFGTDEFIRILPQARRRALHHRQHGHRHDAGCRRLGGVLQRHDEHRLGESAQKKRPARTLQREILGPGQRNLRLLASRPQNRHRIR